MRETLAGAPGISLRSYQIEGADAAEAAWQRGIRRPLVALPTGCHAAGTPVLMHDGSIKPVESVEVGNLLMGPDSGPRTVLRLLRGYGEMRRVVPIKGQPWTVNPDHVLTLIQTNTDSVPSRPSRTLGGSVVDVTVREWESWSKWRRHIYKLFRTPIGFPDRPPPCIDSWLIGILLGDGHLAHGHMAGWTGADQEVVERAAAIASDVGLHVVSDGIEHRLYGRKRRRNAVIEALRHYRLSGIRSRERFVPDDFKLGSLEIRRSVLAGLLDSDGHLTRNGYEFSSVSKRLAHDTAFIARSIGMAAHVRSRHIFTKFAPHGMWCWRVSIFGNGSVLPIAIARKCGSERGQKKDPLRTGFRIYPAPYQDYFGFTVDGDGRYLLGDFTVTHNSGKTMLFGELIRRMQKQAPSARALVLAHRDELLQQAADKIKLIAPRTEVGFVWAESDEHQAPVVGASVQTLARPERLRRMSGDIALVVVDEAHHSAARSYRRLLSHFDGARLVGVTATPERADRARLRDVWDEIVHRRTLPQMIRAGYLCDLRALRVGQNEEFDRGLALDLDRVSTSGGDFAEADLERELAAADAPRYVV